VNPLPRAIAAKRRSYLYRMAGLQEGSGSSDVSDLGPTAKGAFQPLPCDPSFRVGVILMNFRVPVNGSIVWNSGTSGSLLFWHFRVII